MSKAQLSNRDMDSHCTAVPLCIAVSIYNECILQPITTARATEGQGKRAKVSPVSRCFHL